MRALAVLVLAVLLSGCSSGGAAVTEAQARDAPDRLKASMGPGGDMVTSESSLSMSIDYSQDGQQGSMAMAMDVDVTLHQAGALDIVVTMRDFEVSRDGVSPGDVPDMSGVRFRMLCTAQRWVLETEGFAAVGAEDVDAETANTSGSCDLEGMSPDLARLMGSLDEGASAVANGFNQGLQPVPEMEFVRLDGTTAVYRVLGLGSLPGMGSAPDIEMRATFDGQGRIKATTMDSALDLQGMSMRIETDSEYGYGTRTPAPALRGDQQV